MHAYYCIVMIIPIRRCVYVHLNKTTENEHIIDDNYTRRDAVHGFREKNPLFCGTRGKFAETVERKRQGGKEREVGPKLL